MACSVRAICPSKRASTLSCSTIRLARLKARLASPPSSAKMIRTGCPASPPRALTSAPHALAPRMMGSRAPPIGPDCWPMLPRRISDLDPGAAGAAGTPVAAPDALVPDAGCPMGCFDAEGAAPAVDGREPPAAGRAPEDVLGDAVPALVTPGDGAAPVTAADESEEPPVAAPAATVGAAGVRGVVPGSAAALPLRSLNASELARSICSWVSPDPHPAPRRAPKAATAAPIRTSRRASRFIKIPPRADRRDTGDAYSITLRTATLREWSALSFR